MKISILGISIFAAFALNSCSVGNELFVTDKPFLSEHYQISANKNETKIIATIFLRKNIFNKEEQIAPQMVEVNGAQMQPEQIDGNIFPGSYIPRPKKVGSNPAATNLDAPSVAGYTLRIPDYQNNNFFTVKTSDGETTEITLNFDPVEFERTDVIKISRSKENFIKIKGGSNKENTKCGVVTDAEINDFDENLIKIDYEAKQIYIPVQAAKN